MSENDKNIKVVVGYTQADFSPTEDFQPAGDFYLSSPAEERVGITEAVYATTSEAGFLTDGFVEDGFITGEVTAVPDTDSINITESVSVAMGLASTVMDEPVGITEDVAVALQLASVVPATGEEEEVVGIEESVSVAVDIQKTIPTEPVGITEQVSVSIISELAPPPPTRLGAGGGGKLVTIDWRAINRRRRRALLDQQLRYRLLTPTQVPRPREIPTVIQRPKVTQLEPQRPSTPLPQKQIVEKELVAVYNIEQQQQQQSVTPRVDEKPDNEQQAVALEATKRARRLAESGTGLLDSEIAGGAITSDDAVIPLETPDTPTTLKLPDAKDDHRRNRKDGDRIGDKQTKMLHELEPSTPTFSSLIPTEQETADTKPKEHTTEPSEQELRAIEFQELDLTPPTPSTQEHSEAPQVPSSETADTGITDITPSHDDEDASSTPVIPLDSEEADNSAYGHETTAKEITPPKVVHIIERPSTIPLKPVPDLEKRKKKAQLERLQTYLAMMDALEADEDFDEEEDKADEWVTKNEEMVTYHNDPNVPVIMEASLNGAADTLPLSPLVLATLHKYAMTHVLMQTDLYHEFTKSQREENKSNT